MIHKDIPGSVASLRVAVEDAHTENKKTVSNFRSWQEFESQTLTNAIDKEHFNITFKKAGVSQTLKK